MILIKLINRFAIGSHLFLFFTVRYCMSWNSGKAKANNLLIFRWICRQWYSPCQFNWLHFTSQSCLESPHPPPSKVRLFWSILIGLQNNTTRNSIAKMQWIASWMDKSCIHNKGREFAYATGFFLCQWILKLKKVNFFYHFTRVRFGRSLINANLHRPAKAPKKHKR